MLLFASFVFCLFSNISLASAVSCFGTTWPERFLASSLNGIKWCDKTGNYVRMGSVVIRFHTKECSIDESAIA